MLKPEEVWSSVATESAERWRLLRTLLRGSQRRRSVTSRNLQVVAQLLWFHSALICLQPTVEYRGGKTFN